VRRYNGQTGAFIDVFATGSGGFTGLTFGPGGNLFVSSALGDRVLRFDGGTGASEGDFVSPSDSKTGLRFPVDLTFGSDGHLYVASFENNRVQLYDGATGGFIDTFAKGTAVSGATGLAFGPGADLFVTAGKTDRVLRFDGTSGLFETAFVDNRAGAWVCLTF
jgi:WD40 repeat protein